MQETKYGFFIKTLNFFWQIENRIFQPVAFGFYRNRFCVVLKFGTGFIQNRLDPNLKPNCYNRFQPLDQRFIKELIITLSK